MLDIGSGYSTPNVIRWPMEPITRRHVDAHLTRVNPRHPETPPELTDRALGVDHLAALTRR